MIVGGIRHAIDEAATKRRHEQSAAPGVDDERNLNRHSRESGNTRFCLCEEAGPRFREG